MMQPDRHQKFAFRSPAEVQDAARELGVDLPFSRRLELLAAPLPVAGRMAPNRFMIQPMEGFDADAGGTPGALAFRRYRRYAAGGAGLIWFEATAIAPEARSNPHQFWLHPGNVAEFARLTAETRAAARQAFGHEVLLLLQLTHSGRYSRPAGTPAPILAHHSPVLDALQKIAPDAPVVEDGYLETLPAKFAAAARLAEQAGF
ncbi:MAG: flavin oxidoreductase/NADH oxidase, partial [Lentisphaeria bacterium]